MSLISIFLICVSLLSKNFAECPKKCKCQDISSIYCSEHPSGSEILADSFFELVSPTLTNLSLVNCSISNLNFFPGLSQLSYLDLSFNHISIFNSPHKISFRNVIRLDLHDNDFQVLERDAFIMFPNVEDLILSENKLSTIDWEAFRLFKLRRLVLSHNSLTAISEHMLRFAPNLEFLDFSYNNLVSIQSSNFFSAQRLKMINLSHNNIKRFDYDSFSPLYQLQILDLSYNKFNAIPGNDLRQLVGLRVLNLSGNLFDKIVDGDLVHPALQELFIANCTYLRIIESNAFGNVPYLSIVDLNYATSLVFISPYAFENNTLMHRIVLTNTNLEYIPQEILSMIPEVSIANNPLQCGCILQSVKQFHNHIADLKTAYCSTLSGAMKKLSEILELSEECRPEPILPFGEVINATLGDMFSLYCTARDSRDTLIWRLPNGTEIISRKLSANSVKDLDTTIKKASVILEFLHSFGHALHQRNKMDSLKTATKPRILINKEQILFEVVTLEDAGVYRCSVRRGSYMVHRSIKLTVQKPAINLFPIEIGSHFVTMGWNASLPVKSSHLVSLYLVVKDDHRPTSRSVQLSLQNPWFSYNLMRLKPNQNYTFCLIYTLQKSLFDRPMFETCADVTTLSNLSILNTFSLTSLFIIFILIILLCGFLLFRNLYFRFHIWQQQKHRSWMNQSISGQSFLSTTTNRDVSTTFDNQMDMSQIIPLKRVISSSNTEVQQRIKCDEKLSETIEKSSKMDSP